MSDDEPDEFGTRQAPLVVQINKILSDYPPGSQILKELIQNADDANASRVAFLVDPREHGVEDLMKAELARFQGPALVTWNNAKFGKEDWKNIGRLDQSSKEAEVLKVGRFGIGFQSTHHITDVPFIISGKRVGILDPHTVFISNEEEGKKTGKNVRLSEFSKFVDQVAPFVDLFGFDRSTKYYDGTLFRFPFRCNDHSFHSKISDKCYTSEEVIHELYSSLMDEASHILLFLKCIESIELYTWDHTVNAPKLYLQIELEPACVPQVRELRRKCIEHCKDEVSFTAMGAFNVQVTDSSGQKQSFSWLVCNTVGSSDSHVLSLASKLKVLPWCGIAAPLPNGAECQNCFFCGLVRPGVRAIDIAQGLLSQQKCFRKVVENWKVATVQDDGYAFCFLPLKDPTGLPVCIHGYFRVASNRRSIEWPSANNAGESALWNKHLMEALVVPSYAILLASKQYLLSYFGTPALPPSEGVPDPYSWLPLPQEVKHSEIWRHLLEAKPSVQSLVTASPVWWTAAYDGKWVTPDGAYLVTDDVPTGVTKLLVTLKCPVVSLPPAIKECFCYGEMDNLYRYIDQQLLRNQLRNNARAAAPLLKDAALCLKVLEYVTSDLSPTRYPLLEGLPVIPLAQPDSAPVCLQWNQAVTSEELVYIITDDLTRSILPGLDSRLLSHTLPDHIYKIFLNLADSNKFCLRKVTPHTVCPDLIEKSMRTWNAQPHQSVLWVPKHEKEGDVEPTHTAYSRSLPVMPEDKWLTNLWEWFRLKKEVSVANIEHLPIVPMAALSSSVQGQVQLCPLNALQGTSLRQPATAVSQQIADLVQEVGCTLVPHSHIFIGHEHILRLYLPTVSPLSLLRVLQHIPNASQLVENLSTENKDLLRGYLFENIGDMDSTDLALLRSLAIFKTIVSEYISLENLSLIIFPPANFSLAKDVSFPTNILYICGKEYKGFRILLGREPETLGSLIASYVGPFALCKCSDTDRNKLFLWILQQLRVFQDTSLHKYLAKTAFLPSNSGNNLYHPQALYDPEDEFLQEMFLDSESAFPLPDFHSYLVELKDLGLQTSHKLQRNGKAFQSFIVDRAHAVIHFDPAKASQCSKHILKAVCDDADRSNSTHVSIQLRNIPFLFCQSIPPENYTAGLAWAGAAVEAPMAPSSLCAPQDQQCLGHLVGSVSPVLSHQYKRVYNEQVFKSLFKDVSVDMVCQHFKNVVALDSHTISANAASVTKMMESVYLFLQQAERGVNRLAPRYIWHESCKAFVPLEKVVWVGIQGSSLVPYRYTIQDIPGALWYRQLWNTLGMQERLKPQDVQQVLFELQRHLEGSKRTLSDEEVSMVIQILKFLQNKDNTGQVLMPTVKGTLLSAKACTYDDRELTSSKQKLLDNKGIVFTHSDVSKDLAMQFKVPPVSSIIARPKGLKIKCEMAGQSIELTRRIGNIIKDYKDSIDVFKELIQNADDAGATEVKFLIDWRQHDVDHLFNEEMRHWQGPALYAYNNSVFSPEDFENIRQVEAGTKLTDPTKIGRFGLGFCSVYQLTDVPSFLSANKLVVFDPHMHFLGAGLTSGSPGMSIDFVEKQGDIEVFYRDQVFPYHNVFGCNILDKPGERGFQGTLFRFPFRGKSTQQSDICSKTFGRKEIKLWKDEFKGSAQNLLIFLRHVKLVGLYELESGGNPTKDMKEVCVVSCEHETDMFVPRDLVEDYHKDPDGVCGSYSLALKSVSVDELSVAKKGKPEAKRHEQKWLVASAIGSEESFRFAQSACGIAHGLVPLAEVAVKLDRAKSALLSPQACDAGQLFLKHGSRMTHYSTTQQFSLTRKVVVPGKSPKLKKKGRAAVSDQSSSTTWLVASAVGDNSSNSWKQACSVEGKERSDVSVAEVAVPLVDEGGVLLPKPLPTGQVFCFLPLPITISDQKCLINGYFELSKNRRDLAELQDEERRDAWNRLLIRDVLVKAYIILLKHLSEMLPCDRDQRTQFIEMYYNLWPVATASHPLSKELQVAFKKALCHSDVPLVRSLAEGGKWLPVRKVKCLDSFFDQTLFDAVRKDILDILVQQGHSMAELPCTIRMSLCSEPDSSLATVSFKYYCEEVLLKNLPCLPHDVRDSQLLFIMNHLGTLNDAEGEDWLENVLTSTECVPCDPNDTLSCPTKLVFPEGLLRELYDVDEERFPSKTFSEVKQSLVELGMVVHTLTEEDVLERAETISTMLAEKARQRCGSFIQYLTTVHFVHKVKNDPWNWHEHMKNSLIEKLSHIPFLPVKQRPNGSTVPWYGDSVLFASPREVYSEGECDLLFCCKLTADLPVGHDMGKLFLLKEPTHDDILHHLSLIVKWAEAEETEMTPQDHTLLDRCMPAVYERLSISLGCTKQADLPRADSKPQGVSAYQTGAAYVSASVCTTTAEVDSLWKEKVVKELKDRPFIWQESNDVKKFHTPAQTVSDSCLKQTFFPYLVKLSPGNAEYQQFFKALGVQSTLTTQKIAGVLKSIAQDLKGAGINNRELKGFIAHVAQRQFHEHNGKDLVFYLPDEKGVMRDAREMAYPEDIAGFFSKELSHGLTHFVLDCIPKADAKYLGVQDVLANIMRQFEDNEYYKEEDFGQKEEICTRLNNILRQYPADVSIFKEFIQNAEDAMATEIAFVIDHRHNYGQKSLFANQSNWKSLQTMPALLVFNNRKFQEEDIQSIKKLGTGGKADATDKIGRFGVGFNVAYHVTDCPTLVSFGEGGLPENFCAFDPQFKYVPSRFDRKLPGARYRMKNVDGKNSSEHFPDQFAPFLTDVMPQMAKTSPGSFADFEANWPHGYSVFRLPLTRAARHHLREISSKTESKSQELLGHHMTLLDLSRLAKDLTEQAPGMLLFLNHLKKISVFELTDEGTVLSQWTAEARHSSGSQKKCSQFATQVQSVCTTLMGDGGNTDTLPNSFSTTYCIQLKTKGRPALMNVSTPIDSKKPGDQSQQPLTLLSHMRTVSPMPVSSSAVSTKAKGALKQHANGEPKRLTDDKSTEELILQQTDSTWVISKRFGLSDISEDLLYNGCVERLFPLAGVAIPLPDNSGTCNGSTVTGTLYCHLPLPVSTGIPAHINGHFWMDPSRKHLEGSSSTGRRGNLLGQWNATMVQEVASRAYVNAVTHCKGFVKNSEVSCDWFNSLLLVQPKPSSILDDFQFSKHVYQLMIEHECEVLIANHAPNTTTEVEWLALTANTDNPRKGWFFVGDPEVRRVLLSIGVKLVSTPLSLNTRVSLLTSANATEQQYCGEATVELARHFLRKIASCYDDYKDVIVSALVPLLTFVLKGIESPGQCNVLDGLPLMLTIDDQLRLIDTNTPLFSSEFIDLLPEHCMQRFVSHQLMESSELRGTLFKLWLVTPVSPEYLAENIDLPRKPVANLKECNRELLQRLWHYIAISISSTPNVLNCFHQVAIIPTDQLTVVSVNNCKMVLREYGSVTLLWKLQLPVLDFSQVCDISNVSLSHVIACVKERLAVENRADEVLHVIAKHLIQEPRMATIAGLKRIEVDEFVGFLLKHKRLHLYACTLVKLNIYNMISDEWKSLEGQSAVYALPHDSTPEVGLTDISICTDIQIIRINHTHHQFYKIVGVQVLDRCGFYTTVIIPHFQFLPVEAQIAHIQHMRRCNDLIAPMKSQLCAVRFISDDRRAGCLQLASEYYDPNEELLKEFLPQDQFPPDIWCENDNLELLRLLGLRSSVSDDMWRKFAQSVKDSGDKTELRVKMLLRSLHKRIRSVCSSEIYPPSAPRQPQYAQQQLQHSQQELQHAQQQLLQFLSSIASIEFVPCIFPSDIEHLFRQLRIDVPVPMKRLVSFKNAVFCQADETKLVWLSQCPIEQHVLLGSSVHAIGQPSIVKQLVPALGLQLPSVALVCHNLKQLVVCSKQCTVSSSLKSQGATQSLQNLFTCHYDYLAKYHNEQSLREIAHHLNGEVCLFIPSDLSFRIEKGTNLVVARSHRTKPYAMYLPCIPEYLASTQYSDFLKAVGVQGHLSASHYIHTLEMLATRTGRDPNTIRAIQALYHDLIALLEGSEGNDVAQNACAFINGYERPILLPSCNGELLPTDQLLLNDAEWLKERLEQSSDYHFIMPPPPKRTGQVSLPSCLGVQPLSKLIFEELDKAAVLDRDNRCEAELKAEAALEGDTVEGCPYSGEFVSFIQSDEFAHGLRRMISHELGGEPLSREHEQAIEAVQNLDVKCVYAIRTHLRNRDTGCVPGSENDDVPCFLDDINCLYVRFHPRTERDSSMRLLNMVVDCINRILGGSVNSMRLREVLESCNPNTVERILDQNQIRTYKRQEEADGQMSQYKEGQGTEIEDELELILTCNFREGDLVKYCGEDSRMVIATVFKVIVEKSGDESFPFPPTLRLKLSSTSDEGSEKTMSSLLVCKFLTPEQITHLKSLSGALGNLEQQQGGPSFSQEKDVLLELPCSSRGDLQRYFTGISDALEHFESPQRFFAIERLLFQLHFYCVHRNNQPETFSELVEVLTAVFAVHCTEPFIQSLESKISSLLQPPMQPTPTLQPDSMPYERQESYRELSSWSISTVQATSIGTVHAGSTYLGQHISPPRYAPYHSSRQTRVRQSTAHYPILPAPGRLRTGGSYIWGGGMGHSAQQSIWPTVTEEEIPVPAPTVSLEDAFIWLKDACRTVQLVKELEDVKEVVDVPINLEGVEQTSVYKYPETLCFYAHQIVLKCLKAVFFAYCGLPSQLVECSNLVQLHQTLMDKLAENCEVQGVLDETVRSYVHLVSGHGDCCCFPSYDPPALPCETHSSAVAREVMRSAMCIVKEVQKLAEIHAFFPEGLESFTVVRPDSWTAQEGELPSHWERHSIDEEWKIVPVNPHSREFKEIAAQFTRTMPRSTIERIERVQNRVLWRRYHDCKERFGRDPELPSIGEKHLFHGTRQTDPKNIYSSDAGFDVGHSRVGMWGAGNYFAVNASYSHRYAHVKNVLGHSVPLHKMLVAKVLTGLAFGSPPRSELRFPPKRADTGTEAGRVTRRYNSVQGTTGGSEVYITYTNEQAYPAYVISYTN